jgi:hypothetical protein
LDEKSERKKERNNNNMQAQPENPSIFDLGFDIISL